MSKYLKNVLISFNVFISLFSTSLHADQPAPTRQQLWDTISVEVNSWTDGIGYPIDEEIKEAVIALNLMKIETTASCERHLDRGLPHPWVDIQIHSPEIEKILQEGLAISTQISNEELVLKTKFPDLSYRDLYNTQEAEDLIKLNEKSRAIANSIFKIRKERLEPLNQLLDQFYKEHKVSYDNMLIITQDSFARLQSAGANRQQLRSEEEKQHYLNNYREEIQAFAAFLKQKYLEETNI